MFPYFYFKIKWNVQKSQQPKETDKIDSKNKDMGQDSGKGQHLVTRPQALTKAGLLAFIGKAEENFVKFCYVAEQTGSTI